eukprot:scaffold83676_cov34-Phaeocystis_antarctica.AAC.1
MVPRLPAVARGCPARPSNTVLELALLHPPVEDIFDRPRVSGRVVAICGAPVRLRQLNLDGLPALLRNITRTQPLVKAGPPASEVDLQFPLFAVTALGHDLSSVPGASLVACEHLVADLD